MTEVALHQHYARLHIHKDVPRLTGTVVLHGQVLGELSGVVAGTLHGLHTGCELRGNRFLQRTKDLDRKAITIKVS